MQKTRWRAFTIVELLVVVSIIALLVGILLPAIGKAKDTSRVSLSISNLRQLGMAHASYSNEWKDHQFTLIDDNISSYGSSQSSAFSGYESETGSEHPLIWLGWTYDGIHYYLASSGVGSYQPISFASGGGSGGVQFGSFRLLNVEAFHTHLTGRFYDPAFYAPKDELRYALVEPTFDIPGSYTSHGYGNLLWSSYCLSPAAMFHPQVMRRADAGGWQDPWSISGGFRSPSMGQCRYPSLKTQLLEHHWLQGTQSECNPSFEGALEICEPYYFNHSWESTPVTAFYDNHVEMVGVREAMRADGRVMAQTGGMGGLWSRDTFWGENGYYIDAGYDQAATSFHIYTTDGILGRDVTSK